MNYAWKDYDPKTMRYVEKWLDRKAVKLTGMDDGFHDFYEYWANEEGFIVGENYWCKVVFEEEKKKTLRPFKTIDEFFEVTGFKIGDVVRIKTFAGCTFDEKTFITGFRVYTDEEYHRIDVIFGATSRPLSDLFKHFKYFKNGEWLPFGVEE